jgi:hypothetical protein
MDELDVTGSLDGRAAKAATVSMSMIEQAHDNSGSPSSDKTKKDRAALHRYFRAVARGHIHFNI